MVAKQSIIVIKRNFGIFLCSVSGIILFYIARVSLEYFEGYNSVDTQKLLILCSALFLTIMYMLIGINYIAAQKKYKKYENMFIESETLNVREIARILDIDEEKVMEELSLLFRFKDRKNLKSNTNISFVKK